MEAWVSVFEMNEMFNSNSDRFPAGSSWVVRLL
jgi:hypothetical protein